MKQLKSLLIFCYSLIALGFLGSPSTAHEELTQAEVAQYTQDGTFEDRRDRIATLNQFRMAEGSSQRATYKVRRAELEASGLSPIEAARALTSGPAMAFPFTASPELRSRGTIRTLTILIDFKDFRASTTLPGLTADEVFDNIYGDGTTAAEAFKPHESLHEYYRRASQDKVDIQGNILGWYSFAEKRKTYEPAKAPATLPQPLRRQQQTRNDNKAIFDIVSEVLDAVDETHDFTQYDNDHDGDIDLVTILYAGPHTGWGSFWWAYRWEFFIPEALEKQFDGKRAKQFVFQFVETRGSAEADFDPTTLIHEMGHGFGLADYYDYDPEVGPQGGVGGLDMMHANQGNHNAFSRWLLDWIQPTVLGSGSPSKRTFNASGSPINTDKAIVIFPQIGQTTAPSGEMFMIENRHRIGNDTLLPGQGLLIWHVNATVTSDGVDFEYDNSFTERKLIRLVRADNPNDFGELEKATTATYFTEGDSLTPDTSPSSRDGLGRDTGITIDQIGLSGETMQARIGFLAGATDPAPLPAAPVTTSVDDEQITIASAFADQTPLTLDDLEALDHNFLSATADTLSGYWHIYHNSTTARSESALTILKLLAARWASKDGSASAAAILALPPNNRLRTEALPLALGSWANNAPAEAAMWYISDQQQELRGSQILSEDFYRDAFQGLYALDSRKALKGVDYLSSVADIVNAVDGIFDASALLAESPEDLSNHLLDSESDVVKARVRLIQALNAIELQIDDLKQRKEFRELMDQRHPE